MVPGRHMDTEQTDWTPVLWQAGAEPPRRRYSPLLVFGGAALVVVIAGIVISVVVVAGEHTSTSRVGSHEASVNNADLPVPAAEVAVAPSGPVSKVYAATAVPALAAIAPTASPQFGELSAARAPLPALRLPQLLLPQLSPIDWSQILPQIPLPAVNPLALAALLPNSSRPRDGGPMAALLPAVLSGPQVPQLPHLFPRRHKTWAVLTVRARELPTTVPGPAGHR